LLAVISNHRAIVWYREDEPPYGCEQAPPLEPWQAKAVQAQTADAVKKYARRLPERESAGLADLFGAPENDGPPVTVANEKPWLVEDPSDPKPEQSWYTPARYFARQLVKGDSTLLLKSAVLTEKVSLSLGPVLNHRPALCHAE
jgi:hypothetical protein